MPEAPNDFNLTGAEARLIASNAPLIRYLQSRIGSFIFSSGIDTVGLKRWQEEVLEAERLTSSLPASEEKNIDKDLNVLFPSNGEGLPNPELVELAEAQLALDPLATQ